MTVSPFKVTLKIRGPYIPPTHMPLLDGLLWGAVVRAFGRLPEPEDIPLAQSHGVYRASAMVVPRGLDVAGETIFYRNILRGDRELLPVEMLSAKGEGINELRKGDAKRGRFKPMVNQYPLLMPHPDDIDASEWAVWPVHFFGVGDPDRVAWFLRHLPGIGRKAARGFGTIDSSTDAVRVEETPDWSWIHEGRPMRPIPLDVWRQLPGADLTWPTMTAAVAPPYGMPTRTVCVAPDGYCVTGVPA